MEQTPNQEKFKKYQTILDEAGVPVGPEFAVEMEKEMEWGMREEGLTFGGKTEYDPAGGELHKETKFKNEPEGDLYETGLTIEELEQEITDLAVARKTLILFLEKPTDKNLKITEKTILADLENNPMALSEEMWENFVVVMMKYDFDDDVLLSDLVREIEKRIAKEGRILRHKQKKESK